MVDPSLGPAGGGWGGGVVPTFWVEMLVRKFQQNP